MAIIDRNGVYGAPRFFGAAKKTGVKALVGAELTMAGGGRLSVLVGSRTGYKNLCKLITAGAADRPKGQARFTWELGPAGAEAPIAGFDVAVTGGDGRLRSVLGFLDRVPAGSTA